MPPLHAVISATAPLEAALAARAEALWQAPVLEIYGATEVGSIASRRTTQGDAWTLYPGIGLEIGEGVTEVVTEGAPRTAVSDILEPLPDGRFRLLARGSDIIKRGGRRASLAGLTEQLAGLEGVQDAAFLMPDPPRRDRGDSSACGLRSCPGAGSGAPAGDPQRTDRACLPAAPHHPARAAAAQLNGQAAARRFGGAVAGPWRCAVTLLGTVTILGGHPAVPGHFPGDPIIPGVLLLSEIFALLGAAHPGLKVDRLLHAKFLHPVRPDETMAVMSREKPGGCIEFDGMVSDACALRGAVRMTPA